MPSGVNRTDAAGTLDQGDADQGLQFLDPGGEGRLGDEAGVGGAAEMAMVPERHQILELFESRQMNGHVRAIPRMACSPSGGRGVHKLQYWSCLRVGR
jgi:hypothetical protein